MDARRDMQPSLTFSQVRCQGRVSFTHTSCRLTLPRVAPSGRCLRAVESEARALVDVSRWQDEHGPPTLREVRTFSSVVSWPLTHFCE